jgi:DNA-directed RNA polymerase specialized sigma24 family protein
MSSTDSVTLWLNQLKSGDRAAVGPLWERYFRLLVHCARSRLASHFRRAADEEDVALSAFVSFCQGVEEGRFPQLDDRNDLGRLLMMLTARKVFSLIERESAAKRGGGEVSAEADLPRQGEGGETPLEQVLSREPTPEMAACIAEEWRCLLERLAGEDLRSIALWQVEGYTVDEIAAKLGRSPRTVARKLAEIRDIWSEERSNP